MLGDTVLDLDHPDSKAGYLIRMLAYRYQVHDFTKTQKPHVAFYFYGKQGYGKTIFSTVLHEVFGPSAVMATPDERSLNSMSFVDIFSRTWAVVDEVNIAKGSTDYNAIKTMTGNTRTDAARKGEHFKYRYKIFDWFFPTMKWILRKDADEKNPAAGDIYVFFSYSDNPHCATPCDTLAVELTAWTRVLADVNREHQTLPVIIGNEKPLL